MSLNYLIAEVMSIDGEHLYPVPTAMDSVNRVSIGSRSLNFGTTTIDGKKYIVLLAPVEVSGIKIEIRGI